MVALRRERVTGRDPDFMAAHGASEDACIRGGGARGVHGVKRAVVVLRQMGRIFVESHLGPFDR